MPKGKSTYNGGWDGKIISNTATEFIPEGVSLWEFGTEKSPTVKAEKDYQKRILDSLGEDVVNVTIVFVTTGIG